jgi:hypothetical protein
VSEEVVASILPSLIVGGDKDRQDLLLKAVFEAGTAGLAGPEVAPLIIELRALLERIL